MKLISRIEEIILISIWRLQDNAYGITILEEVKRTTGQSWLTGSIYAALGRLLKHGYVMSIEGEPSAERGGRRKIFYKLTHEGQQAVCAVKRLHDLLWSSLPPFKV